MGESSKCRINRGLGAPIRYLLPLSIIEAVEEALVDEEVSTPLAPLMDVAIVDGPNCSSSLLHSSSVMRGDNEYTSLKLEG